MRSLQPLIEICYRDLKDVPTRAVGSELNRVDLGNKSDYNLELIYWQSDGKGKPITLIHQSQLLWVRGYGRLTRRQRNKS